MYTEKKKRNKIKVGKLVFCKNNELPFNPLC